MSPTPASEAAVQRVRDASGPVVSRFPEPPHLCEEVKLLRALLDEALLRILRLGGREYDPVSKELNDY